MERLDDNHVCCYACLLAFVRGVSASHTRSADAGAIFGSSGIANGVVDWQQFRRHNRAAVQQKDRKYYAGKKIVAHNRAKRTGQMQPSLRDLRKTLAGQWRLLVAKPAATVMAPRTSDKLFVSGDTLTTGAVVRGYSSTKRRVYFVDNSFAKIKETTLWKCNSGLILLPRGAHSSPA